jgi:hypothetical protein
MEANVTRISSDLSKAILRANPAYDLLLSDQVTPDLQNLLADLRRDPTFHGVLMPRRDSALGVKSVSRDVALLYSSLRAPGLLSRSPMRRLSAADRSDIVKLILDGVLEIAAQDSHGSENFVSGADAYHLLYGDEKPPPCHGAIAQLSKGALVYAQHLEISDRLSLSARLYFYNRQPASPYWIGVLPTDKSVARHLALRSPGPTSKMLSLNWTSVRPIPAYNGWRIWRTRRFPRSKRASYKLYVSPSVQCLPDALAATLVVLGSTHALRLKVGRDIYNLLRPDKLIVYFDGFDELHKVAEQLTPKLSGLHPHGVPFTAGLTPDGMLSWGMDPPDTQQALHWQERESWRLWLTNRLATALLLAKAARRPTLEPWLFALRRVQLEGIEPGTWHPDRTALRDSWT